MHQPDALLEILYLYNQFQGLVFFKDSGYKQLACNQIIEHAIDAGDLSDDAHRFKDRLSLVLSRDKNEVFSCPLDDLLHRPDQHTASEELAQFIRSHVQHAEHGLKMLLTGQNDELRQYRKEYVDYLKSLVPEWHAFVRGDRLLPPIDFRLIITTPEDLDLWTRYVAHSPYFQSFYLPRLREALEMELQHEAEERALRELKTTHQVQVEWSPVRRFPFAEGYGYEATAKGSADNRTFEVNFEHVFDFGLIVRTSTGSLYRSDSGEWRTLKEDRPVDDPDFVAFLEVAYNSMPHELRWIRL